MMIFPVLLLLLPAVVFSANLLRGEEKPMFDYNQVKGMTVAGTFPADPVYALTTWYNPGCTTVYGAAAILMNTCLTNNAGLSEIFVCSNNTVTLTTYSDNVCGTSSSTHLVTTCTPNRIDIQNVYIPTAVTINSCEGNKDTILTNVPDLKVEHGNFADAACTEAVQAAGFFNDFCYPAKATSGGASVGLKFDWPEFYSYPYSNCTGVALSGTISKDCTANPASSNPIFSGAYGQFWVTSDASQSKFMGMGVMVSLMMVFFQLFKN